MKGREKKQKSLFGSLPQALYTTPATPSLKNLNDVPLLSSFLCLITVYPVWSFSVLFEKLGTKFIAGLAVLYHENLFKDEIILRTRAFKKNPCPYNFVKSKNKYCLKFGRLSFFSSKRSNDNLLLSRGGSRGADMIQKSSVKLS